jgi:hypothetical protein
VLNYSNWKTKVSVTRQIAFTFFIIVTGTTRHCTGNHCLSNYIKETKTQSQMNKIIKNNIFTLKNENLPNVNLVLSVCQLIVYLTIPIK